MHTTRIVEINGLPCRIWEKGQGKPVYWLASSPLLLKWTAFHDAVAAGARLVVCGLPGFPGSKGHDEIDDHLAWCLAARDLLLAAGFQKGDTLHGSSTAGAIAADVAALWPDLVGKLILTAPFGLYDQKNPSRDMFALQAKEVPSTVSSEPDLFTAQVTPPEGEHPIVWQIMVTRGNEAAARFLWPLGDTRLARRLHRIIAPTLLLWGDADQIMPRQYADRFAEKIAGKSTLTVIKGAGHLAELDRPKEMAQAVLSFAA